ncbi:MAG: hypothetical protein LUI13_04215 [Lachnospiraceae bacterium]|nr:hypothetical protein [Lachnospiraceae bacterium]
MYAVSDEFLTAVQENTRTYYWKSQPMIICSALTRTFPARTRPVLSAINQILSEKEEHDSVNARIAGNMARKKTMEQFIGNIETQEAITK